MARAKTLSEINGDNENFVRNYKLFSALEGMDAIYDYADGDNYNCALMCLAARQLDKDIDSIINGGWLLFLHNDCEFVGEKK